MATWRDVRRLALALPETSEATSRGTAGWVVNGKKFVWERPLRPADFAALGAGAPSGAILGVRTADLEHKDVLLASDPDVFFSPPHFAGYPAVLVQLANISTKQLRDVIVDAWLTQAPKRVAAAFLAASQPAPPRRPCGSIVTGASSFLASHFQNKIIRLDHCRYQL